MKTMVMDELDFCLMNTNLMDKNECFSFGPL